MDGERGELAAYGAQNNNTTTQCEGNAMVEERACGATECGASGTRGQQNEGNLGDGGRGTAAMSRAEMPYVATLQSLCSKK